MISHADERSDFPISCDIYVIIYVWGIWEKENVN